MQQDTENENTSKFRRYVWIGVSLLLLLGANYIYFKIKVSSNHDLASHYTLKGDPMEKYRNPAVAGLFYSATPEQLTEEVDFYLNTDYQKHASQPRMIIVPHAGYQYSASAAAQAFLPLKDYVDKIKTVILIGPSHYVELNGAALPSADYFKTPLGKIAVNKEISQNLQKNKNIIVSTKAHEKEHSLEVQLPFLQKVLKKFDIVPLVYGDANPQTLAEALQKYVRKPDVLLLVSADLSHYHNYNEAIEIDYETATKIANGKADVDYHHSCGATGINTAMILGQKLGLKPEILALINSGDVSDDKNRVVGYGAWSYSEDGIKPSKIDRETEGLKGFVQEFGTQLLGASRKSLEMAVNDDLYRPSRDDYDEHLFDKGAVFVTLHKNGELRGCIGSLYPRQAVVADVAANTFAAAMEDTRFAPLSAEELPNIKISISLLTGYEKIYYKDEEDLLNKIIAGVDGIVIRDGDRQGLFLPSVWEQLPDKKEFLNNLKLKAGMSPSFWSNDISVYRFRTVEVKENGF